MILKFDGASGVMMSCCDDAAVLFFVFTFLDVGPAGETVVFFPWSTNFFPLRMS